MSERFAGRPAADLEYPRQQARTRGYSCGQPRTFTVSPDGERVVFLRSLGDEDPVLRLWVLDVPSAQERCVFDPLDMPHDEVALTPAERARRERVRERATGVVAYACDRAVRFAVFVEAGRLMLADLLAGEARQLDAPGTPDDPRLAPDGSQIAFVYEGALWVRPARDGAARVVAEAGEDDVIWGLAEFAAAEELDRSRGYWWSPDGRRIAVARVDERPVQTWWITDPTDPHAEPVAVRYPRAGTDNAIVTLHVVDLSTGVRTDIAWSEADRFEYLSRVDWDEHGLTIEVLARDFTESRVLVADPVTGSTTVVASQTSDRWLDPIEGLPARLDDGRLVTSAAVEGVRAVMVDGERASPPGFHTQAVLGTRGDLVFCVSAYGDPMQEHIWTVGPHHEAERLTRDHGVHVAVVGAKGSARRSWLEDRQHAWCGYDDGDRWLEIANLAQRPLVTPAPRFLRLGERGLPAVLHVPGGKDPAEPLPVLISSYGGPHVKEVIRWMGAFRDEQFFADRLGVAVLTIDGRGMLGHDLAWEHAVYRDFGLALDDQVAGLHAAAGTLGFLDLDRVAFRGWSFGGMLAAMAVLRRPDVFHAAVSGAPVSDQRLYDTAYTERFLGRPQDEPEAYRVSSPISFVDDADPQRPLLLIHGLADDNVFAANTLQLSAALFARGYHHDLVLLPNASHIGGFDDLVTARYVAELDFLRRSLALPVP
ncbi:MAG: DPP IV N-terminal domain-containing protein [Actinomycetota bacterium]